METKRWKHIGGSAATLACLTLLLVWVFRDHWREILRSVAAVSAGDFLLLLGMGAACQLLEAAVCLVLVRGQLPLFSFRQAVGVTYLGVFGNVSTLSAGTVPMQSWYLCRQGLMPGSGAGLMTLEYALHKSSVLLYATLLLALEGPWLREAGASVSRYLAAGYLICAGIIVALVLLCTWERARRLARWGLGHLPDTGAWGRRRRLWEENLDALYRQSRRLLRDRGRLGAALALNGPKLCCLYAVPYVCARALGIPAPSFWRMNLLMALTHLISNALPNVAGVGPLEFAFMLLFPCCMGYAEASSVLILYRVATFFAPFLMSAGVFWLLTKKRASRIRGEARQEG